MLLSFHPPFSVMIAANVVPFIVNFVSFISAIRLRRVHRQSRRSSQTKTSTLPWARTPSLVQRMSFIFHQRWIIMIEPNPRISVVLLSRLILNLKLQTDIPKQSFATSNASAPPRPVIIAPHILGNLTAELRGDDLEEVGPEEIGLNVLHIN